jgi:hypothetical protein
VPFVDFYQSLRSGTAEDHAAYLAALQKLPSGPGRRAALIAFFQAITNLSTRAAADLVRQVSQEDMQRAVTAVLAAAPAADTALLVQMLVDLPPEVNAEWRQQQIRGQMFFWAALDPLAAAQFAESYRATDPSLPAYGIIQGLAVRDPAAAARWLAEHPELANNPSVVADYVQGLYQHDKTQARSYVAAHANEETARVALRRVVVSTFIESAESAAEFVKQLSTPKARQVALSGILDVDVSLFADDAPQRSSLYAGIAEWVTRFPPTEWPDSMAGLFSRWRRTDADGALSWVAQAPPATRPYIAAQFARAVPSDQMASVLASAHGEVRSEVLAAFARTLPPQLDQRKAMISALGLTPGDAAQLMGTAGQ